MFSRRGLRGAVEGGWAARGARGQREGVRTAWLPGRCGSSWRCWWCCQVAQPPCLGAWGPASPPSALQPIPFGDPPPPLLPGRRPALKASPAQPVCRSARLSFRFRLGCCWVEEGARPWRARARAGRRVAAALAAPAPARARARSEPGLRAAPFPPVVCFGLVLSRQTPACRLFGGLFPLRCFRTAFCVPSSLSEPGGCRHSKGSPQHRVVVVVTHALHPPSLLSSAAALHCERTPPSPERARRQGCARGGARPVERVGGPENTAAGQCRRLQSAGRARFPPSPPRPPPWARVFGLFVRLRRPQGLYGCPRQRGRLSTPSTTPHCTPSPVQPGSFSAPAPALRRTPPSPVGAAGRRGSRFAGVSLLGAPARWPLRRVGRRRGARSRPASDTLALRVFRDASCVTWHFWPATCGFERVPALCLRSGPAFWICRFPFCALCFALWLLPAPCGPSSCAPGVPPCLCSVQAPPRAAPGRLLCRRPLRASAAPRPPLRLRPPHAPAPLFHFSSRATLVFCACHLPPLPPPPPPSLAPPPSLPGRLTFAAQSPPGP